MSFLVFFDMFVQVTLVKSSESTYITWKSSLFTQMFTQYVSIEVGHNCEFGPAISTGVPEILLKGLIIVFYKISNSYKYTNSMFVWKIFKYSNL